MYNTNNNNVSEEQISSLLKDALERVEGASEADIQLFNMIKKLYKQNVPFSRRKYVAAYMVKQALTSSGRPARAGRERERERDRDRKEFSRGEGRYSSDRFEGRRSERSSRYDREPRQERPSAERSERPQRSERPERAPRVQIDPAVADTVFISIGRNRRVYPRDLVGLLVSVSGLQRERIGDIRVLANYSFVQLFKEDCDKVISSLNDYDYRGRKLSVSYSKKGEGFEAEGSEASGERPVAASSSSGPERQAPLSDDGYDAEEKIPANVSNASYGVSETSETSRISEEQSAFAARQSSGDSSGAADQYSTTTEDGQVTSHFGTGAAY